MDDEVSNQSTFDIYSDILLEQQQQQQTPHGHSSVEQLEKANAENEAKVKELTAQLLILEAQKAAVVRENETLKTNISQLFKTAQAELKRKDRELEQLAQRSQRSYRQEQVHCSSINDRLRDLRKNQRDYPCRSNGVDAGHRWDSPSLRQADCPLEGPRAGSVREPGQPDSADPGWTGFRQGAPGQRTQTSSGEAHPHAVHPETGAKLAGSQPGAVPEAAGDLSTSAAHDHGRERGSRSRSADKTDSDRHAVRKSSISGYRIPKKSSSARNHPAPDRVDLGSIQMDHGLVDARKTSHRSTRSPPKYSRDCGKSEKARRSSLSQHPSGESPKSRERSHEVSVRAGKRSCRERERHSGRKRRLSPEGEATAANRGARPKHRSRSISPLRKHRGRSISIGGSDEEGLEAASSSRKRTKRDAVRTGKSGGHAAPDAKTDRGRHKSRTHSRTGSVCATDAGKGERSRRRRHESERKNKSLKRARETLHRMHCSTPRKHEDGSSRHGQWERHVSERSRRSPGKRSDSSPAVRRREEETSAVDNPKQEKAPWRDLGDGVIPETEDANTHRKLHRNTRKHSLGDSTEPQPSAAEEAYQQTLEYSCPEDVHMCTQETRKSENLEKMDTQEETTAVQCVSAQIEELKADRMTEKEVQRSDEIGQQDMAKGSGSGENPAKDVDHEIRDVSADVVEGILRRTSLLTSQPDPDICMYDTVHETDLICTPSQDEGSSSDFESRSSVPPAPSQSTSSEYGALPMPSEDAVAIALNAPGRESAAEQGDKPRTDFSNILSDGRLGSVQEAESPVRVSAEPTVARPAETEGALISKPARLPRGIPDDSFSERIYDAFGSISFLESDDLESSKDVQTSFQSLTRQPGASSPGTLGRSRGGDSEQPADPSRQSLREGTLAESLLEVFGSNSLLESDDLDSSKALQSDVGQHMDEAGEAIPQGANLTAVSGITADEQSLRKRPSGAGHTSRKGRSARHVSRGRNSPPLPDQHDVSKPDADTDIGMTMSTESSVICSTEAQAVDSKRLQKRRASLSDRKVDKLPESTSECYDSSDLSKTANQRHEDAHPHEDGHESVPHQRVKGHSSGEPQKPEDPDQEPGDLADISINLTSCDVLSCSASPAHGSLLGDSEESQSDLDEDDECAGNSGTDEHLERGHRAGRAEHETGSQHGQSCGSATPSEANLSDGEIVSSSDSEAGGPPSGKPPTRTPVRSTVRRPPAGRPKASRKRSRTRERRQPPDRGRRTVREPGGRRPPSDSSRSKFFENKLRILQERRKAQDHQDRHLTGYQRDKRKGERPPPLSHTGDRKGRTDEENAWAAGSKPASRWPALNRREAPGKEGPSSRRSSDHGSRSRGHDADTMDRHRSKPDRGSLASEAPRPRDKRSRDHRR